MPRAKSKKKRSSTPARDKRLILITRRMGKKATKKQIKAAFRDYDLNGDGEITVDELKLAMRRLSTLSESVITDDRAIYQMLKEADIDRDGTISEDEFLRIMTMVNDGEIQSNWDIINASAAADVTLNENKETLNIAFEQIASLGRQVSEDIQVEMSPTPSKNGDALVGWFPRILVLLIDLLYATLVFCSILALEKSIDSIDFNTFWYLVDKVLGKKGIEQAHGLNTYVVEPFLHMLEDAIDGGSFIVTITIVLSLIGFATYGLFARSQTFGQIILNHVPVVDGNDKAIKKYGTRLRPFEAVIYYLLSIPCLDYFTGLAGKAMQAKMVFAWSIDDNIVQSSKRVKKVVVGSEYAEGKPLSEMVHIPWTSRPFNNALTFILYLALTYFLHLETSKILGSNNNTWSEYFARKLLNWHPFFQFFQRIPEVIFANKGLMAAMFALAFFSASAIMLITRSFLRPLLYCLTAGGALITVCVAIELAIDQPNTGANIQLIAIIATPVAALRYIYQYRAGFELQIAIYKEAISETMAHPLLAFVVPCCECLWQIYQFELLTRYLAIEIAYLLGSAIPGKQLLMWLLRVHQFWTLYSTRILFEMACSSVIGQYYFRKSAGYTSNTFSRTINGLMNTFVKGVGTALTFGILQKPLNVLRELHSSVKKRYDTTSWVNPVKIILFVLSTILAFILAWFEALFSTAVTYAGITGEGVWASGKRAMTVMKTDTVLIIAENSGTAKLTGILVSGAFTLSACLMNFAWIPMKKYFGGLYLCSAPSTCSAVEVDTLSEFGIKGVCYFCMFYLCISMIWVLQRASSTVTVCVLDEVCHDPKHLTHSPPEMKEKITEYLKVKSKTPSILWNIIVMFLWAAASLGVTSLNISGEISQYIYCTTIVVLMAIAILW